MTNKICLILPYFGKLPDMFPFFYQSCIDNSKIDFLIFTNEYNKVFLKRGKSYTGSLYRLERFPANNTIKI